MKFKIILFLALILISGINAMIPESESEKKERINQVNTAHKIAQEEAKAREKALAINWRDRDESVMAGIKAKRFVKSKLRSPSTAEFPGMFDDQPVVNRLSGQEYLVNSYVDSQNGFGATIRSHYTVKIKQDKKDQWELVSIVLN